MKNTKRYFKLSLSTLLIIALVFSLLSYDTTTSKAEENKFMRYYDGNEVMYVNINNCIDEWWKEECVHRVYFFGQDTAWATLEQHDDTGIFKVRVPQGQYNKLIICRCKDKDSTWENKGVYNKTGDISILPGNNYICIFNGEGSKVAGWTTYEEATTSIQEITKTINSTSRGNVNTGRMQGGVILHAFCWTFDEIKNNLADIKEAGYTAVQTSPIQPAKDYSSAYTNQAHEWWKLYQPLGFTIASTDDNYLGTKQDLIDLCKEADNYGINIICDIVANHLAGKYDKTSVLNDNVGKYESEIYNNQKNYVHNYLETNDYSVERIVNGNIGVPDIATESNLVQQRVIALLKECIDCGVDGFRFDASKHIETPDDDKFASDFWPNITSAALAYGKTKNKNIYLYGEILSPLTCNRSFSSYTKYMNITDNRTSDITLNAVYVENAGLASSCNYASAENPSNLVLWSESHDTYMNDHSGSSGGLKTTKYVDQKIIDKGWAIIGSRADATALYLSRPNSVMGKAGSDSWKKTEVAAVNHFHNNFFGSYEYLSSYQKIVINERYFNNGKCGAVLTNIDSKNNATLKNVQVNRLKDGQYIDAVTKNIFTVTNGYISGNIGNTGIAVLYQYK